ncbi:hypothetical protein [Thalassolituus oleivorans]|uniref:Uncharacterized protein n=1 Tax=Thalassolituus oleivorans MIL-1 TaxID=1298593 RepID=M5E448_9GAMM|nr:hypothetical protein [Thalassolituus oleivorans]CCU72284.1 hypothetical protein TOL_1868 [Thalassolituus oleivorans MIL-1]
MSKNSSYGFFKLFTNYFWLGIVFVLLAIVLDLQFPQMQFGYKVLVKMFESVGIAILVASIFTYASGTSEFVEKIKSLLQDIVVSRNFLGNIDSESKREALNALIKPSMEEKRAYSNIEDYLNTYINQAMDVTSKCVRSNYLINARAYIDSGTVFVDSSISYRLYPTKDGYSDIRVGFLKGEEKSSCRRVVVNTPHGERQVIDDFKYDDIDIDAGAARLSTITLSKYAKNCSHLDISIDMTEAGSDHWVMLSFATLIPTDGFRHVLRCEDGLVINAHHAFIHGAKFYIDQPSNTELTASCNEWINEGTGLSVLISLPHVVQPNKSKHSDADLPPI